MLQNRLMWMYTGAVSFCILGRAVSDTSVGYTGFADKAGVISGRVGDRPS